MLQEQTLDNNGMPLNTTKYGLRQSMTHTISQNQLCNFAGQDLPVSAMKVLQYTVYWQ